MVQPEIVFIKKFIAIRKRLEKLKANKRPGVMEEANWLDRHIQANEYSTPETAQAFLKRHIKKVEYIVLDTMKNELKTLLK